VTALFAPVRAATIRYTMDTCSTLPEAELHAYREGLATGTKGAVPPGTGWIYEIEVFARLGRLDAWRGYFFR
jgi:hypothetical protein